MRVAPTIRQGASNSATVRQARDREVGGMVGSRDGGNVPIIAIPLKECWSVGGILVVCRQMGFENEEA